MLVCEYAYHNETIELENWKIVHPDRIIYLCIQLRGQLLQHTKSVHIVSASLHRIFHSIEIDRLCDSNLEINTGVFFCLHQPTKKKE